MGCPGWRIMPERTSLHIIICTGCQLGISKATLLTTNYAIENSFIWPTTFWQTVYLNIDFLIASWQWKLCVGWGKIRKIIRGSQRISWLLNLYLMKTFRIEWWNIKSLTFQVWLSAQCVTLSTFSPLLYMGCLAPRAMPGRQTPPYTIYTGSQHGSSSSRLPSYSTLWDSY